VINGTINADNLSGTAANDTINALAGDDTINGLAGNDQLSGGAGNDRFVFNSPVIAANADTITDFALGDLIALSRTVFTTLSAGATLTAAEFGTGATALNTTQRILFNPANGQVLYDSDGSAAGAAPVLVATVSNGATLTAASFALGGLAPAAGGITGTANADTLTGTAAGEAINGLGGNDTLNGAAGDDTLDGGAGSDRLTGGLGNDGFLLADAPGATNIETITDFALGDRLLLRASVFTGLTPGAVATTQLLTVRSDRGEPVAASTAAQRLVHDRDTDRLFYDSDGTGPAAIVQIASFSNGYRPLNTDFLVL
jgi:Ca2+-binding RTX toxin-like protein